MWPGNLFQALFNFQKILCKIYFLFYTRAFDDVMKFENAEF